MMTHGPVECFSHYFPSTLKRLVTTTFSIFRLMFTVYIVSQPSPRTFSRVRSKRAEMDGVSKKSRDKLTSTPTKDLIKTWFQGNIRHIHEYGSLAIVGVKYASLFLFLFYVGVPVFVRANQWILPKVVFSNLVRWPPFTNLSNPSEFGLNQTRAFKLQVKSGINIGAWHVLPKSIAEKKLDLPWENYEDELSSGKTVFLYLHGNTGTRGSHHRVQLYKLLSSLDFHVVTIDYRGYGDSSGDPTEDGVVMDAYFTYKWLRKRIGESKLFIWGHSLGTGVTTKLAKKLCDEDDHPAGIILESPFNNIQDAAIYHPFSMPFRFLPWFEWIFVEGIGKQGIFFNSDENILSVTPNIMILHAKDDLVVPFHLGKKLYQSAKERRNENNGDLDFVAFESHLGLGHKLIYQAPTLPDLIRSFVAKAK